MPNLEKMTPVTITTLERRIAEEVMDADWWKTTVWRPIAEAPELVMGESIVRIAGREYRWGQWSPCRNTADAVLVLERLRELQRTRAGQLPSATILLSDYADEYDRPGHNVRITLMGQEATGNGIGPAVCELAKKFLSAQPAEPGELKS